MSDDAHSDHVIPSTLPPAQHTLAIPRDTESELQPSIQTSSSNQTTIPVHPEMELAIVELENTIQEAELYRQSQQCSPRHLNSHVAALNEDIELVAGLETADDMLRTSAAQLLFKAKRLRRHIEREAFEVQPIPAKTSTANTETNPEKLSGLKLTPLKVPQFDGETLQFFTFKNFFEENVLHNSQLTDTSKWMRLRECITGPPAQLLAKLPQTAHTLQVAWKLLQDVYGGDDKTIVELYDQIRLLPTASAATQSLRMTHSGLEGIFLSLEHVGHNVEGSHYLRGVMISKFPVELLYHIPQMRTIPLKNLRQMIGDLIANREIADFHKGQPPTVVPKNKPPPLMSKPMTTNSEVSRPTPRSTPSYTKVCVFCAADHWNDECTVYPTIVSRKEKITGKCLKCLKVLHPNQQCIGKIRCYHCDSYEHNRALCPQKFKYETPKIPSLMTVTQQVQQQKSGYFMTFVAEAKSCYTERTIPIRVVVDTAGGATVITKETAEKLKLPFNNTNKAMYTGLGGTHIIQGSQLDAPVHLLTLEGSFLEINASVVTSIVPAVPTPNVQKFRKENPACVQYYIPPTGEGKPVDLLLGSDVIVDILLPQKIVNINADTLLMPTVFGSLLLGRQKEQQAKVCHSILLNLKLQNPLKLISDLDLVGLADLHSTAIDEEQQAIRHFYETVTCDGQRYAISWPWKTHPPVLDTNYGLSLGRLRSLHKKLSKAPNLLTEYHNIIQQQLADGIIEKVNHKMETSSSVHYLPHHPILQPEKSTSVRPVYDGAAKTHPTKLSLNENILKGTKWLNDLIATLLRFRRYKVAVTADIAKAFHQIAINPQDRDVVRFLWLKDPFLPPIDDNLQIFRFTRLAFGIIASPFILSATINYHASKQQHNEFTEILLTDLYADNLVATLENHINPVEFYEYAKTFFNSMKMNLTKWTTNDTKLENYVPKEDRLLDTIQSVLGIHWNRHTDRLLLKPPKKIIAQPPTKRTVAKEMAEFFDPLGWAAPIVLLAKIFLRELWNITDKWDDELGYQQAAEWNKLYNKLRETEKIELPRQMSTIQSGAVEIHTFVDASMQAYAVVTYLRVHSEHSTQITLIAAKSRLTPKKQVTIPKLELAAAVLGCRFTNFVRKSLNYPQLVPTYLWSDSKCAIAWLQQKRILPPIIHRYVEEASTYGITQIKYVPSEYNYADVATRGATFTELADMDWWQGPKWLHEKTNWPEVTVSNEPENTTSLIFQNQLMSINTVIQEENATGIAALDIRTFSSLTKLLKMTALIFQALQKILKNQFLHLDAQLDLQAAERKWILWDQNRQYRIKGENQSGKPYNLRNITVFRDSYGLIRCQSRLVNSFMDLNTSNPILLVKKSTFTRLIVLNIHMQNYHAGTSHTLATLRKKYWLPQGRREVYSIILKYCTRCRRYNTQPFIAPPPIPLPDFRILRTTTPFQIIGIDVFGPILARTQPGKKSVQTKVWGLLITCSVVRAIHIEMLNNMTTEELLAAFRRFVARRGVPHQIISDNAPQFHRLDGCIKDLWKEVHKSPVVSNYLAEKRIEWKFISELSPWMGGFYERLVQSVKTALEKTYGNQILLKRQLHTALIEIESVLNSRPIAYVDRELETPILTPNDFLSAKFTAVPLESIRQDTDDYLIRIWKSSQYLLDKFWENWADQYLLMLRERHDHLKSKNGSNQKGPEKGDVVIMVESNKKRSQWQLAVVERLIKSTDGKVRSVQIRIPTGSRLIRPVIKLAPLNLIMNLPKISDDQLAKNRSAIVVWPGEGASQEDTNTNMQDIEKEQQSDKERVDSRGEVEGGGSGTEPYHSNGSENELGHGAAEFEFHGTETRSLVSSRAGSVVERHE